jgi:hypothetical protein
MLTRKRKRATRLEFLSKFCILESATRFLEFRDCAQVDLLSRHYHSKLWLNVLKCSSRSCNADIRVDENSEAWLTKYATELKYQALQLNRRESGERAWNNVSTHITRLRILRGSYIDYPIIAPMHLGKLTLWSCTRSVQLRDLNTLEIGFQFDPDSMRSLPASVSKLKLYYPERNWIALLSVFPHVTTLNYASPCYREALLTSLLSKFPALETLKLECRHHQVCNLEALGTFTSLRKLTVCYTNDLDLSGLKGCVGLEELDLSKCPKVLDFSHVRHVPIVHKYQQ